MFVQEKNPLTQVINRLEEQSSFTLSSNIKQNTNSINIKRPNNLYSINNTFREVVGVVDLNVYKVNIFNSKSLYRYNYFESSSIGCYEADDIDFNVYTINKNEINKME